jgi:hypothetical protein
VRLGIPGFFLSKVSQKVTAPPNCRPQFPLTGVGDGVDVDPDPDPDPDADVDPDPDVVDPDVDPDPDPVPDPVPDPDPDVDPDPDPDTDPEPDADNTDAEQLAVVPPLEPPQLHVHGPEPATDDDVPVEQRLVEGADDTLVPFADPHAPLTATAAAFTATVVLATEDQPPHPVQVSV